MENKRSKFFKKGSTFLIAPALFSNFLPGMNTSAVGETVFSKTARESVLSKPGSETLSFFKNHWGWFLVGGAVIACLLAYWFWPSNSEASGSNSKFDPKISLGRKVEKSELKEDTLEDVLKMFSGEKFSKWITKKPVGVGKDEGVFEFSSAFRMGVGRLSLFKLVVNETEGDYMVLRHEATFSCIGSNEDEHGKVMDKIFYLDNEEGLERLKDIGSKIYKFLTVFDKVIDLCASKKIVPVVNDMNDGVKSFKFDLKPAREKGLSLELGLDLNKNNGHILGEIEIRNNGEVYLQYVDSGFINRRLIFWNCLNKEKSDGLDNFEEAFSSEKGAGWTKKVIEISENKGKNFKKENEKNNSSDSEGEGYSFDSDDDD